LDLTNQQIRDAEKQETQTNSAIIKVKFNTNKKTATDAFAEIIVKPITNNHTEIIQKEFHY